MSELTFDEIKAKVDSGDMDVINGLVFGSINPVVPQQQPETPAPVEQPDETPEEETVTPSHNEEIEKARNYAALVEKREREERERLQKEKEELLRKTKEIEDKYKEEQKTKEEVLRRLQQLESQNVGSTEQTSQEDDEFVSDFAKRTRQEVEELKRMVGTLSENDPTIRGLKEGLDSVLTELNTEKEKRKELEEKEKQEKLQNQMFDNISKFQSKYPELKTEKHIKDLNEDYVKFRKDISYLSGARSVPELEKAIDEYYNNGKIKELADKNGIKPVSEYDKITKLMKIIDLKDGVKYNPATGNYDPIVDDVGVQVRYRSLDEAYKVENFYDEMSRVRKQSYTDVKNKLDTFNNAPVTLPNNTTTSFNGAMSPAQISEAINLPTMDRNWYKDPNKFAIVNAAYNALGLQAPDKK